MHRFVLFLMIFSLYTIHYSLSQELQTKKSEGKKVETGNIKLPYDTQVGGDKVIFRDGTTPLLDIENLDNAGGLILYDAAVSGGGTGRYLMNLNGNLMWNGSQLGLAGSSDNDWTTTGNDLYNSNSGNVGIGTTSPPSKLAVFNSYEFGSVIFGFNQHPTAGTGVTGIGEAIGVYGESSNTGINGSGGVTGLEGFGYTNGVVGLSYGDYGGKFTNTSENGTAVYGYADNSTGSNYGGKFEAKGANGYGVHATAPTTGFAGYFDGNLHVTGNITSDGSSPADNTWTTSSNNIFNANSGNVGIGTSPVGGKLHVKGTREIIWMESSNADSYMAILNDIGSGQNYVGYLGAFNGDNDLDLGTGGSNSNGNLNLVTQATPRFIIANDGRAGLGALEGIASLNVRGISGDLIAFRVEEPGGSPKFQVSNDGHVGINQWYSNVSMNIRGVASDVSTLRVEDPSGAAKFTISNSGTTTINGRVGVNTAYPNVTANIRGISGDGWYFTVEGPTGSPFFDVFSTGNAQFYNDLTVNGNISKGGGSFKIDHPLDPTNKNLYHSFVESPDMMNIYNGNVSLDGNGEAIVTMADWFEALNKDFRYQLTAIGAPGPNLYIAEKINGNKFRISGGSAGMEVSWQVTGVRQDAYANENRIEVEELKKPEERGKYLHPTAFGQPKEMGISFSEKLKREEQRVEN